MSLLGHNAVIILCHYSIKCISYYLFIEKIFLAITPELCNDLII